MAMRVGWILKAGDFLRGSAELSAALRLLLLVLFLQKQEKYEQEQFDKFQFVVRFHALTAQNSQASEKSLTVFDCREVVYFVFRVLKPA